MTPMPVPAAAAGLGSNAVPIPHAARHRQTATTRRARVGAQARAKPRPAPCQRHGRPAATFRLAAAFKCEGRQPEPQRPPPCARSPSQWNCFFSVLSSDMRNHEARGGGGVGVWGCDAQPLGTEGGVGVSGCVMGGGAGRALPGGSQAKVARAAQGRAWATAVFRAGAWLSDARLSSLGSRPAVAKPKNPCPSLQSRWQAAGAPCCDLHAPSPSAPPRAAARGGPPAHRRSCT